MSIQLPILPYEKDFLVPYISEETLDYHYNKHHIGYVNNLNNLIVNTKYDNMNLEDIISNSEGRIFNNSAQIWNHNFYWKCLSVHNTKEPYGNIRTMINKHFGSFDTFKNEFTKVSISIFGSGWCWLVQNRNFEIEIISTNNANTPITLQKHALLCCDVWEHAYYIDYRNNRNEYVNSFWSIINWDFVNSRLLN